MQWSVLPLLLLLVACRWLDGAGAAGADRIPMGTLLDLHRDLTIPPDQAGVFIQGTPIGDRDRYDAACRLEIRSVEAIPRTVRADRFTVVRVVRDWERFSRRETGLRRVRLDYDGPALLRFSTALYLHAFRPSTRRVPAGL